MSAESKEIQIKILDSLMDLAKRDKSVPNRFLFLLHSGLVCIAAMYHNEDSDLSPNETSLDEIIQEILLRKLDLVRLFPLLISAGLIKVNERKPSGYDTPINSSQESKDLAPMLALVDVDIYSGIDLSQKLSHWNSFLLFVDSIAGILPWGGEFVQLDWKHLD